MFFYSENNINALYESSLFGVKTSLKFVRNQLEGVRQSMFSRPHNSINYSYTTILIDWSYNEIKKRTGEIIKDTHCLTFTFLQQNKSTNDKFVFNKLLNSLEAKLLSGKKNVEYEKQYSTRSAKHRSWPFHLSQNKSY